MKVFMLTSLVFLAAVGSSFASMRSQGDCEDAKLKALKEIVETQREKDQEIIALVRSVKAEKLQPEESLNKLTLAMTKLSSRLDVIEETVDTQVNELKIKLEGMQASYEEVLQRIEALEHQENLQITEASVLGCQPPFEAVGDDCVYWHDEGMSWEAARSYCQDMGARLIIPTVREGFELAYGTRSMSESHPPLIDFLYKKKDESSSVSWGSIYGWLSASVDADNKATWTSGEELKCGANRIGGNDRQNCIAAYVTQEREFGIWTASCVVTFSTPLCQKV